MNTDNINQSIDTSFDIVTVFKEIRKRWLLYGLTLAIALTGAFLYNKYATVKYKIISTILINISEQGNHNVQNDFLSSYGLDYFGGNTTFSNELLSFGSTPLIKKAVSNLDWKVSYYRKSLLKLMDIYPTSPFKVLIVEDHPQIINTLVTITFIDENKCRIQASGKQAAIYDYQKLKTIGEIPEIEFDSIVTIGQKVDNQYYSFVILYDKDYTYDYVKNSKYAFRFNNLSHYSSMFKAELTLSQYNEESSVLNIELIHSNPRLATDFIESLTNEYMKLNIDKKNHAANQTIRYIDSQIGKIEDSLDITESALQDFRVNNQVIDLATKSRTAQEQLLALQNERASLEARVEYYKYLDQYFRQDAADISDLIAPSAMRIEDPLMTNLIQELIGYDSQLATLERNNQQRSPMYKTLQIRIENLNKTINENLTSITKTTTLSLNGIDDRIDMLQHEIQKLPGTNRKLTGLERKYNLNNEIYTYLLQRRAESEIARASYLPDNVVIEPTTVAGIAAPKKKFVYAVAVILALMSASIPVVNVTFFNSKVINKNDLKKFLKIPFIGAIYHNPYQDELVYKNHPGSHITESFGTVRTNLDFLNPDVNKQVFLVTSSTSAEGKSFFAANLAHSMAVLMKKVILLDFDLRKPTLSKKMGINANLVGITDYLINQAGIEDIITRGDVNLDLIFTGKLPPNPTELIYSKRTSELIKNLREMYDCVIIDSPPIGFVPDANYLLDLSDIAIFVTRQNFTDAKALSQTLDDLGSRFPNKIATVLNDYKYYRSSMDFYTYKYYKQYYKDDDKKSILRKMLSGIFLKRSA